MLTGNDLLTKIEELRNMHPDITNTEIVLQCGYVKENGNAAYANFYSELLAAKGMFAEDDEVFDDNKELYE
jgi:hypothetical protein